MRLIDADALIEDLEYGVELDARMLDDMDFVGIEREQVQNDKDCKQNAIDILELTPTIEERKTGKWIWDVKGYHCSECFYHAYGNTIEVYCGDWNYCPICGAKMEGEQP